MEQNELLLSTFHKFEGTWSKWAFPDLGRLYVFMRLVPSGQLVDRQTIIFMSHAIEDFGVLLAPKPSIKGQPHRDLSTLNRVLNRKNNFHRGKSIVSVAKRKADESGCDYDNLQHVQTSDMCIVSVPSGQLVDS